MRIAINVVDLTRVPHPMAAELLLGPVTPNRILVNADPTVFDEGAVVVECDEKRARAIAQIFRDQDDRRKQYRTRVYFEGPRGGWTKAAVNDTILEKEA